MSQKGLGRGLASLIPDQSDAKEEKISGSAQKAWGGAQKVPVQGADVVASQKETAEADGERVLQIAVADIVANPYQPRKEFEKQALEDLKESIAQHGILQPLVVVKKESGYELIAGERRLRAAQLAGLSKVPALVRAVAKQQQLELSLIENIQRQNLNPIEEALSYKQLSEEFDLSQEDIAKQVGKSRSTVANSMRLLDLPQEVQKLLVDGKLTSGHGKVILELDSPEKQIALAKKIIRQQLTVRDTETDVKEQKGTTVRAHSRQSQDPRFAAWEKKLQSLLGTKVSIKDKKGSGSVQLEYFSQEELMGLIEKLSSLDDLS